MQILGPDGEWITTDANVSFDQLTDEQLALINGPMVGTNTDPVDSDQTPGFPDQSDEMGGATVLGNPTDETASDGATMPGIDIENSQVTIDDIVIENRNGCSCL